MNEKPILFSGEMIRAILDGHKTQTRRVIKPQPMYHADTNCFEPYGSLDVGYYHPVKVSRSGDEYPGDEIFGAWSDDGEWGAKCPYGQPGDTLWVRETWTAFGYEDLRPREIPPQSYVRYRATNDKDHRPYKWRPSIYMPRWASRITLQVKGVRVERVREISEGDAKAEGVNPSFVGIDLDRLKYRAGFMTLWDSINAKRGYGCDVNPWVWVVDFEVAEK